MTKVSNRDYVWKGGKGITVERKTVTAASGAATLNAAKRATVTSEALTTAAGATYTLTLTNNTVKADSLVLASVRFGTSTTGVPVITRITPAAGSVVIVVQNIHASAALNGTIVLDILVA